MPTPDGPFIFVSYSSKDAAFVHLEIKRLERRGYKIWYDKGELQPARFWAEEIRSAIAACACFMVFITEDSVVSDNVCDEIDQALAADKPFIGIYWDNVELPSRFQKLVRSRQTLDRHSMHPSAYEEPLLKALSEYITLPAPPSKPEDEKLQAAPVLPPPVATPDVLPKLLFFSLVLLVVFFFFLAFLVIVTPNIVSAKRPDDILNNRFAGLAAGLTFIAIAFCLAGAAFAVFRIYLRKRK